MKINKIFSALMGGAFLFGMAACTDEVEYTPVDKVPGNAVYFPVSDPSTVEIATDATTCQVMICRENADAQLTVGLSGEVTDQDSVAQTSIFTVPSQVTFPAGVKQVPVVIDVNFASVVPEYKYLLDLSIKGEDNSPYGLTKRTFTLSYEPWTEWAQYRFDPEDGSMIPLGTPDYATKGSTGLATITQAALYTSVIEVPVYVRGSVVNPNKYQFCVPDPVLYDTYKDDPDLDPLTDSRYLYIINVDNTWTVDVDGVECPILTVPAFSTTVVNSNYGEELWLMDILTWYADWRYSGRFTPEYVYENAFKPDGEIPSYYDVSRGLLCLDMAKTMPSLKGTTSWFGDSWEYVQLPGFKDYAVTMTYSGNFVDGDGTEYAYIQAYKGADANSFAYKCVEGALTDTEVNAVAEEIKADTNAELVYDASTTLQFQLKNDGAYTVVAVSYNEAGEAVKVTSYTFNYKTVQAAREWVSVGMCKYSEGLIYGHWSLQSGEIGGEEWDVEVEANTQEPGRYRLVNPYRSWPFAIQYANYGIALTDKNYYIEFNALYDNATYMVDGDLGVDLTAIGLSPLSFSCDLYDYLTGSNGYPQNPLSTLVRAGFGGIVEDGVVGFPAGAFGLYYVRNGQDAGSYTNFSDELLGALEAWNNPNTSFWTTVPDPAYGMGYTTIDMSEVTGEYAPGQLHFDVTSRVASRNLKAPKQNRAAVEKTTVSFTGRAKKSSGFGGYKATKVAHVDAVKAKVKTANVK